MKLEMDTYLKLCEITGGTYKVIGSKDDNEITLVDIDNALEDLITEFGVVEEKYSDMKEKTANIKNKVEEKLFLIDMVDHWDNENKLAYDLRKQEIEDLDEILGE